MSNDKKNEKPAELKKADLEAISIIKARRSNTQTEKSTPSPVHHCRQYSSNDTQMVKIGTRGFKYPKRMRIYYIFEDDNKLRVRNFEYKSDDRINHSAAEKILEEVHSALHLYKPVEGLEEKKGNNFEGMYWNKRCYVVFMIDNNQWRFVGKNTDYDPVQIVIKDELGREYSENSSFFDGATFNLTQDGQAFAFINHALESKRRRPDENKKPNNYRFDIFLLKELYDRPETGDDEEVIIIDPPGDHMGPPWGVD